MIIIMFRLTIFRKLSYFILFLKLVILFIDPGGGEGGGRSSNGPLICAGCLNAIEEDEFIQALNHEWHIDCFQ